MDYLEYVMRRLANVAYNGKNSNQYTKEDVVKAVESIINEYNEATGKNIQ